VIPPAAGSEETENLFVQADDDEGRGRGYKLRQATAHMCGR